MWYITESDDMLLYVVYIVVISGICTRSSLFHPVRAFQVPMCATPDGSPGQSRSPNGMLWACLASLALGLGEKAISCFKRT